MKKIFFFHRYEKHLASAKSSGIRKGGLNGVLMGTVWFLIFCTYALVHLFICNSIGQYYFLIHVGFLVWN